MTNVHCATVKQYICIKVSKNGLEICKDKIDPILSFPNPTNPKETKCLLGTFSYYKRFIPHFTEINSPLYDLVKANHPFYIYRGMPKCCGYIETSFDFVPMSQIHRNG